MGQDLQVGICAQWRIRQRDCVNITREILWQELGTWVDTRLYDLHETVDYVEFTIKFDVVSCELTKFLSQQYAIIGRSNSQYAEDAPIYQAALDVIDRCPDLESVMDLANEAKYFCFQNSFFFRWAQLDWRTRIRYECKTWSYILEGKIFMDSYQTIFAYLAEIIRTANPDFKIAGAVMIEIVG